MPKYKYTAVDINGKNINEVMFASNKNEFAAKLKKEGLYCVSCQEIFEEDRLRSLHTASSIKVKDLSILCKQFSTMLGSGITIIKSLDVLYQQTDKKKLKNVLLKVFEQVQTGKSLSEAMLNSEGAFPAFMISMVNAGEMSGSLDKVMERLSEHYEKEVRIKNKITSAMIYPIMLTIVGFAVIVILFTFVMPTIMTTFSANENLPLITKILFALSDGMRKNWFILLSALAGALAVILIFKNLRFIRSVLDRIKIYFPFFGDLYVQILSANFCRTMCSVLSSGMSLLTSLELTANVMNNLYVSSLMKDVTEEIREGKSLSSALSKIEVFPKMMITMLSVGEESGSLDNILKKTSDYYDVEADNAIQKMVAALEPAMIVVLGIIIGIVVIGIMAPIYGNYSNIG